MAGIHEFIDPLMTPIGVIGVVGQSMYFFRFLVQWITSERRQESVVPVAFWYLSIVGAVLVLIYGFSRKEPLLILGQAFGLIAYSRNLVLVHKRRQSNTARGTTR